MTDVQGMVVMIAIGAIAIVLIIAAYWWLNRH
jgi:hypothetical protein